MGGKGMEDGKRKEEEKENDGEESEERDFELKTSVQIGKMIWMIRKRK